MFTEEKIAKMRACLDLLPEPGGEVVSECLDEIARIRTENERLKQKIGRPINILFDGPPINVGGRFIEVETDDGQSINAGEWIKHGNDMWALRITKLPGKPSITKNPPMMGRGSKWTY